MTAQQPAPVTYPGKTLGIVGLIASIPFNVIGLIISIVALVQSKKAGFKNTPALIGIIIGAVLTLATVVFVVVVAVIAFSFVADCAQLGPGVHELNGVSYTCN